MGNRNNKGREKEEKVKEKNKQIFSKGERLGYIKNRGRERKRGEKSNAGIKGRMGETNY